LRTHSDLSSEDIQYASNVISSLFSENDEKFSINQLLLILVYMDQTGICKFALTFNQELDKVIKNKDQQSLLMLLMGPKELFIELYNNPYLLDTDKENIIQLLETAKTALYLLFTLIQRKIINMEMVPDPICTDETQITFEENEEWTELTTKCYDEVCLQESSALNGLLSKYNQPPSYVFTIDKSASAQLPQIYCFNLLELIDAVTKTPAYNPKTGRTFSDLTLKIIEQRFRKEIALYKRFLELQNIF
jgi:hypothetical protein